MLNIIIYSHQSENCSWGDQ